MEDESGKLKSYLDRIERLQEAQNNIAVELVQIKKEIRSEWYNKTIATKAERDPLLEEFVPLPKSKSSDSYDEKLKAESNVYQPPTFTQDDTTKEESFLEKLSNKIDPNKPGFNWEKFIGENLISKLGVLIIIIGVVIGAKYSIENDLINPTTRIALGYLAGLAMLGVGIWSKARYLNYSAVLVSGAMAILFFITFFAYNFYHLLSLEVAFGLMVLFTIFTVIAAIQYNKQVIAIIGLVGAYAVPFLLSNDSGAYEIFFAYVALVNVGILIIAFRKDWKYLYYITFVLTWLIYLYWFVDNASETANFSVASIFLGIYFSLFYALFLAYKLFKNDSLIRSDIMVVFINASIFFLGGYVLLQNNSYDDYLGLFTLGNGVLHFLVASIVYKKSGGVSELFYLLSAIVLVFITIAIPIQLKGNVVPILWVVEATLLFWIGRTKKVKVIEYFSYPLMILAGLSILQSWSQGYLPYSYNLGLVNTVDEMGLSPIFNSYFLTSVIAGIGFGMMWKVNNNYKVKDTTLSLPLSNVLAWSLAVSTIFILYMTFKNEIGLFWDLRYADQLELVNATDSANSYSIYLGDISRFKAIWISIFTMLFFSGLSWLTMNKVKSNFVSIIMIGLNTLVLFSFLTVTLYSISELRNNYLDPNGVVAGHMSFIVRYVTIFSAAVLMYATFRYQRHAFSDARSHKLFSVFLHISLLWVVTSEYIHWADIFGMDQNYKLSLSILWGVYSVALVSYGIWKNRKHLRIMAIALFAITLVKLFVYDIAHLDTISKTIVFVSLGVLLLIISFLYNKFTSRIHDEPEA